MFPTLLFYIGILLAVLTAACLYIYLSNKINAVKIIKVTQTIAFSIIVNFVNINCLAFFLAVFGLYSLILMDIFLWLEIGVLLLVILKKENRIYFRDIKFEWEFNRFMLLLLTVCFVLYCFFPTQYLWGRRDPAVYVIKGVNIAQSGSTRFETNEYLNENYDKIKNFAELTYRGIYSEYLENNSDLPGDNSSQFLDFFPAILAVGYSLAGLDGLFSISSLIAMLCIIAGYYYVKYLFGKKAANIAMTFLAFCPAQVWGARITQTELLYQLFWILALFAFSKGWEKNLKVFAYLTGALLGLVGLNRMDSYILGAGVFSVACYCNLFLRSHAKFSMKVAMSYSFFSFISFCYSYIYSYYYFESLWEAGVLAAIVWLNIFMFFASIVTYIVGKKKSFQKNIFAQLCEAHRGRLIVCWVFYFVLRLVYYARPLLQEEGSYENFNKRAFMEFCWYTSPLVIPLLAIGCFYLMKNRSKRQEALLFFATGFSSLCVYIWKPSVTPDHIWASRRWISVCIPFVFILMSYAIDRIAGKVNYSQFARIAATGGISLYLLAQCELFLFTPMLPELPQQYKSLLENMDEKVYFAEMSHFASILRFVYGRDVFVVKADSAAEMAKYIREEKKAVYYIGSEKYFNEELLFEELYQSEISGTYLNQINEYPSELMMTGGVTNIYKVTVKD